MYFVVVVAVVVVFGGLLLLLSMFSWLLLSLWFRSSRVSGCGYVNDWYISFIYFTVIAKISGD